MDDLAQRVMVVTPNNRNMTVPSNNRTMYVVGPYPQRASTAFDEDIATPVDSVNLTTLLGSGVDTVGASSDFTVLLTPLISAPENPGPANDLSDFAAAYIIAEVSDFTIDSVTMGIQVDESIDIATESPTVIAAGLSERVSTPSEISVLPTGDDEFAVSLATNDAAAVEDAWEASIDQQLAESDTPPTDSTIAGITPITDVIEASADSTPTIQQNAAGVEFDAVAAGSSTGSWPHTIAGNALLASLITVNYNLSADVQSTASVKVGSVAMTQLSALNFLVTGYLAGYGYIVVTLWVFGLLDPPTGVQTVMPTVSAGGTGSFWLGNSASYNNVTGFGTAATAKGVAPADDSITASSVSGQMVFAALAAWQDKGTTFGAFNQTQRATLITNSPAISINAELLLGDTPGTTTVTFSAPAGSSDASFGAVAIPLT